MRRVIEQVNGDEKLRLRSSVIEPQAVNLLVVGLIPTGASIFYTMDEREQMQCLECGGKYNKKKGNVDFVTMDMTYRVDNLSYYQCDRCKNKLYDIAASLLIETTYKDIIREKLLKEPLSAFITSVEVRKMLTAFKLNRVKRFTYNIKIGDRVLYLKDSVLEYRNSGEGRYIKIGNHDKVW